LEQQISERYNIKTLKYLLLFAVAIANWYYLPFQWQTDAVVLLLQTQI
jgi:hypothetical protein